LKTAVTNRFSEHETPPVIKKDLSKNLQPEIRNPKSITANQPKVESRTTRTAGGLDFTAIGGKRQGREVPQSLPVEPDAKSRRGGIWKTQLTEHQIIDQNVQKAAAKYDLSPDLIRGVIRAESNFKVKAVSSAGAQGLMQLMPATAKELGVKNSFDIGQNIDGGAKYLRKMLNRFGGNIRKALAAYNAGPGTVIKYNGRVPYPETRQYVKRVLRFSRQMA
jgi:soluble lytic murein transglycosylase-like protein